MTTTWGSTRVASRGRLHDATALPGFVAAEHDTWLGYALYDVVGSEMEIVVLDSPVPRRGAGSALIARCVAVALERCIGRLWLITTNDNIDALRFYQRRGFRLVALRAGAVGEARRTLKAEIPEIGTHGIPIRDELELELPAAEWPGFAARHAWPSS